MMWTPQMDSALRAGIKSGLSSRMIAELMSCGLTRNAVIGRCFRLGVNGGTKRQPSRCARRLPRYRPSGRVTLNAEIFRLVSDYARQEKIGIDTAANELLRQSLGAMA
jgi:hypothetical protein